MNYKNCKDIIETLPFKKTDEWIRIDILMAVEDLAKDYDKELKTIKAYMIKWAEELGISGINSKAIVRAEIEAVLGEMKE